VGDPLAEVEEATLRPGTLSSSLQQAAHKAVALPTEVLFELGADDVE